MLSMEEILKSKSATKKSIGQQLKEMSDYAMQETWNNDIQTRTCYIYDYFHDNEEDRYKLSGYDPSNHEGKIGADLKFIVKSYKSMSKDEPDYHIQFSPDDWNGRDKLPDYFYDSLGRYDVQDFVGLFVDIPDDRGVYHKWLITYYEDANQFPKLGVVKCNYVFQWITDKKNVRYKRKMCGVERIAKSYTAGTWSGDKTTVFDEQSSFILPWNVISSEIKHDQRIVISMPQEEPYVYKITKVNNTTPKGIINYTLKQDMYNDEVDYVSEDLSEMYCNYYDIAVKPTDEQPLGEVRLVCNYNTLKLGARGYRTITSTVIENDIDITDSVSNYTWEYFMDDVDCKDLLVIEENNNIVKIKLSNVASEEHLDKVIVVKCTTDQGYTSQLEFAIMNL